MKKPPYSSLPLRRHLPAHSLVLRLRIRRKQRPKRKSNRKGRRRAGRVSSWCWWCTRFGSQQKGRSSFALLLFSPSFLFGKDGSMNTPQPVINESNGECLVGHFYYLICCSTQKNPRAGRPSHWYRKCSVGNQEWSTSQIQRNRHTSYLCKQVSRRNRVKPERRNIIQAPETEATRRTNRFSRTVPNHVTPLHPLVRAGHQQSWAASIGTDAASSSVGCPALSWH